MTNKLKKDKGESNKTAQFNGNIDFDLKMVRGMALTYFIYGLVYYLDIRAFLVPLPIVYYVLPIAGVIMFVRSLPDFKSMVLLFIPVLVLKDIWIDWNPFFIEPLLFISLLIWIGWGVTFLFYKLHKHSKYAILAGISQFLIVLILIPGHWLIFPVAVAISLIMITIYIRANLENSKLTVTLRISLLIQLMYVLYIMQVFSNWQNS